MKRKLLTVLLAVVMVFGVFGLTACGSNKDADYNYYTSKYQIEDVKIQAVTYQAVYKMFTTAGAFLLYVDSEGEGAAARLGAINDLANEWDVTIYHFNPDLAGGFAASAGSVPNILAANPASTQLKAIQDELVKASNAKLADLKDNALWGITGAESTVSGSAVKYNGKLAKAVAYSADNDSEDYAAVLACSQKMPSFGDKAPVDQYLLSGIKTMNLFGDTRLHMYDDRDALTEEKTDLYVTVANYGMFEDLLLNNEGYFPVFFGGTWCPNTQAIAKLTNDIAKDYGIEKIYFFDPRLDDGVRLDAVADGAIVENKTNITGNLNTRNTDAANQWKALTDGGKAKEYLTRLEVVDDATAGFVATTKKAYSSTQITAFANNAIIAKADNLTNKAELVADIKATYTKKAWNAAYGLLDYADEAAYVASKNIKPAADRVVVENYPDAQALKDAQLAAEAAEKADIAAAKAEYKKVADQKLALAKEILKAAEIKEADVTDAAYVAAVAADARFTDAAKAACEAAYKAEKENYGHLYAAFLDSYIKDADGKAYASMWNVGSALNIGSKVYTKMCVPNIMMFNGEGEGAAILVALAEAEYTWANTSVEGNPQNVAWTTAVKAVFDANPYAEYLPMAVAPEAAAPEAAAPSAPAAGGDAGGC